jgi:hypothetical protein
MLIFFSGGGRPWIPEKCLGRAEVMLSYFVDTNKPARTKPGARMRRLMKARELRKKVKR